jgi:hypothetical protein
MNTAEEKTFEWIKTHYPNLADVRFYMEYFPKYIIDFVKNFKLDWIDFLREEKEKLTIEKYALQNKRLNEKHGDFNKDHNLYGGVTKALEIPSNIQAKMAHVGEERDFQKEVNSRTEPYSHYPKTKTVEKKLEDKQEELKGKGLGEIVGFTEEIDERRAEER